MRVFWRTLAVIGGVVVLLLVAVAIAVSTVDVKEFIGPLQQRVKAATGRDFEVRGGIQLKLGLTPKLVLDEVTLGNAPWGKQPQMVTAKHVEASIALLPLLRRRFEVTQFKLIEPTIALETDEAGKGNWVFPALAAAPSSTPAPSGGTLGGLVVGDLAIADGAATYRDGKTGEVTTIVIEDLSLHARDAQSPVSGSFRGRVNTMPVALEGDFGPLEQLTRQRWPYPVAVQAEIGGKKAAVHTQLSMQGNAVTLDALQLASGASTLTGKAGIITGGARPKFTFTLAAPTFALDDFSLPASAPPAAKVAARSKYVFSEQPLDLAALKDVDADGEITIGTLNLTEGRHIDRLHVKLALANGKLEVPLLQAAAFGGTVNGRLEIDAVRAKEVALKLNAEAQNLELGALLAAAGVKRELRGGRTEVKADLSAHGVSPRQWASSANGNFLAVVGPATIVNPKGSTGEGLDRLLEVVNPFRSVDATTELHCVVVRLPIKDGVAPVDQSIAGETSKIGATASGTLDFRTEVIDLSIKPRIRQGIPIAVPQVAQLVHFRGSFTAPTVGIDATATAETVARLGAAVATGGLSIVGESLFAKVEGDPGAPCQIALGRGGTTKPSPSSAPGNRATGESLGKAVGHLFGR